jgi:hypothetical protein
MEKNKVNASLQHIPRINVSREADIQFMRELERTDRERYDGLVRNMMKEAVRLQRLPEVIEMPGRKCGHCGLVLPKNARTDSRYCDDACRKASSRLRLAA